MHLGAGKNENASDGKNNADLRVKPHLLLGHWLDTCVFANVLHSIEATHAVPFCVIINSRTVANGLTPVMRMKSHNVFWNNLEYRNPPVELALWG